MKKWAHLHDFSLRPWLPQRRPLPSPGWDLLRVRLVPDTWCWHPKGQTGWRPCPPAGGGGSQGTCEGAGERQVLLCAIKKTKSFISHWSTGSFSLEFCRTDMICRFVVTNKQIFSGIHYLIMTQCRLLLDVFLPSNPMVFNMPKTLWGITTLQRNLHSCYLKLTPG